MVKIHVKTLKVGDVEDPEIYLGPVIWDWLQTDHGKWCKEHAGDMVWHSHNNYMTYENVYKVVAVFKEEDAMIYKLKWGDVL